MDISAAQEDGSPRPCARFAEHVREPSDARADGEGIMRNAGWILGGFALILWSPSCGDGGAPGGGGGNTAVAGGIITGHVGTVQSPDTGAGGVTVRIGSLHATTSEQGVVRVRRGAGEPPRGAAGAPTGLGRRHRARDGAGREQRARGHHPRAGGHHAHAARGDRRHRGDARRRVGDRSSRGLRLRRRGPGQRRRDGDGLAHGPDDPRAGTGPFPGTSRR